MRSISLFSKQALGIILMASAVMSCKKDNSSTPTETEKTVSGYANISYFAKASASGAKTTTKADSVPTVAVSWTSASVYVDKISFTGKSSNLLDTTIIVEKNLNIFSADALAGVIKLPAGSYKDVNVKLYCKKSAKSELAFNFKGTFTNTYGQTDSVLVGSSYPFEANLSVTDIVIDPSNNYKVTFGFDLSKVLTGISAAALQSLSGRSVSNGGKLYVIWKGGSADEPFYDQVIKNWQSVGSVVITKE